MLNYKLRSIVTIITKIFFINRGGLFVSPNIIKLKIIFSEILNIIRPFLHNFFQYPFVPLHPFFFLLKTYNLFFNFTNISDVIYISVQTAFMKFMLSFFFIIDVKAILFYTIVTAI